MFQMLVNDGNSLPLNSRSRINNTEQLKQLSDQLNIVITENLQLQNENFELQNKHQMFDQLTQQNTQKEQVIRNQAKDIQRLTEEIRVKTITSEENKRKLAIQEQQINSQNQVIESQTKQIKQFSQELGSSNQNLTKLTRTYQKEDIQQAQKINQLIEENLKLAQIIEDLQHTDFIRLTRLRELEDMNNQLKFSLSNKETGIQFQEFIQNQERTIEQLTLKVEVLCEENDRLVGKLEQNLQQYQDPNEDLIDQKDNRIRALENQLEILITDNGRLAKLLD